MQFEHWFALDDVKRRDFIHKATIAGVTIVGPRVFGQTRLTLESRTLEEVQQSDPDVPPETIRYSAVMEFAKARPDELRKYPIHKPQELLDSMLKKAGHYADLKINRGVNEREITQFLNLLDHDFREDGNCTAFCAAGVSFVACEAYCGTAQPPITYNAPNPVADLKRFLPIIDAYYFFPSVSVEQIQQGADHRGRWIPNRGNVSVQRGWLIVFTFLKNRRPSHIGIIERVGDNELQTIEFNTSNHALGSQGNGGCVARKTRIIDNSILGYITIA